MKIILYYTINDIDHCRILDSTAEVYKYTKEHGIKYYSYRLVENTQYYFEY